MKIKSIIKKHPKLELKPKNVDSTYEKKMLKIGKWLTKLYFMRYSRPKKITII